MTFPKGMEFLHDIYPGKEEYVIRGMEYMPRIMNAVRTGYLVVVDERIKRQEQNNTTSEKLSDGSIVSVVNEEKEVAPVVNVDTRSEMEQYETIKGSKKRIELIEQMKDVTLLRLILATGKSTKIKAAAERRIKILLHGTFNVEDIVNLDL